MPKKHVVKLKAWERLELEQVTRRGRRSVRELARARVLLAVDCDACTDEEAAETAGVSVGTVERSRRRFCTGGLRATLRGHPQPPRPHKRKIDGEAEAKLVTLACSTPPDGRERWTLDLLADRMVKLRYVDGPLSGQTVRRVLKKRAQAVAEAGVVHPAGPKRRVRLAHGGRTGHAYKRPYDPKTPGVALDEPVQLLADVREPISAAPGMPRRRDHEYKRNGTANGFVAFEPLGNWRRLAATDRRTRVDWARVVRDGVDAPRYRDAEKVVLVQDQLNTHTPASLYEAFEPAEAKRIADKLEIHYTPQHGSWLNVAEVELSVLGKRLKQRIGDKSKLADACAASERERNRTKRGVNWRFTTTNARVKLKRLYPTIEAS